MKTENKKSNTMKVINVMIVAVVAAGSAVFVMLNQASAGRELMPTIFLAFLGAIITVQVIPGVVLLGSIMKGVFSLGRKQVPSEVSASNEHK
jgi:membrane protein YdbS with pleckstrin-like domain